ncbi:MAG TPA: TolC family protein [Terracidiphilus sp.]|nr:TolC family protein [Terracidiphilus sp.]
MHLHHTSVSDGQEVTAQTIRKPAENKQMRRRQVGAKLRGFAAVMLTMASCMPSGLPAQTPAGTKGPDREASTLPTAPAPVPTDPFDLNRAGRDFSKPYAGFWSVNKYRATSIPKASFENSVRLNDMVKDGKIYLSLSDAIALALENNYDIAIARYDLNIADTDILRAKTGAATLGVPSGLVTNTLGGSTSTLTAGGGPGGTTVGSGGAGSGTSGLTLTTAGAGPAPANLDPNLTSVVSFDRNHVPATSFFSTGTSSTNLYNFALNQGFITGTNFQFAFNNTYATSNNTVTLYSPELLSNFKATLTQHLLQGAGIWVNKRFIYQALNDRRIVDSSFRQQLLFTVNQVESIYWGLAQAYEDVQAKQHALDQSSQLLTDNRKQLEIGTMAPLDVVNAESTVSTDKQALIISQNALNYQQQIIKQAIARNLNDPALSAAPVIPTDRVSLEEIPEESAATEALVQEAFQRRPELEQAVLTLRNDEITLKGARNALLPTFDVYGYYQGQGVGGSINGSLNPVYCGGSCPTGGTGYGTAIQRAFDGNKPDKGIGFNLSIPLRNRLAESQQERSLMEYRQAELRLAQLYTQIRMQVVNAKFALTNDRAQVQAASAARDFNQQSLDAEVKKLRLGASTTANVLSQERNLAVAENNLIAAHGAYAKDRAGLYQILASTLQHYGINLPEAASGEIKTVPVVPGVQAAPPGKEPSMTPPSGR